MKSLSLPNAHNVTSLAIGKFDGMHLAHSALLKRLDSQGALLCIETSESCALTPKHTKERYTKYPIFYLPLNEIKNLSGAEFARFITQHFTNLKKLVVGYDFRFGKDRAFGASDLEFLLPQIEIVVVEEFCINEIGVHSSLIKDFIATGNLKMANALLGRAYSILGASVQGQNLGSKELFATINIRSEGYFLPENGVYATLSKISCDDMQDSKTRALLAPFEGKSLKSVSFIGNRLSTDRAFSVETHILDSFIPALPPILEISFIQKLRDNRHFQNLSELKSQIATDIAQAKNLLEKF
ncbi:bifunctional riboflavin kinase/FAD synthetase [Helicobacter sp. MIT 00-7814]|uniref:riboflavin kinase n=1 Tax=unclassified Helicobacter TaxID=2593540 RepID=UPI000E1FB0CA|nr:MULTISPECIES: riboflavin kinase [unclassified Helicobacter]RDU53573.1 bifunctional riboflavin kinase/FAD synthetase [Helicobacter sp. MIT 00-7814]RDU57001.1 bifunctional riboflavin kinase/FAD synthetase [Helicobacter sp. MIT 99-10781]